MEEDDNDVYDEFDDFIAAGSKYKAMKESLKIDFDTVRKEIEADELKKTIETETKKENEKSKKNSKLEEKKINSSENGKSKEQNNYGRRKTRASRKRNNDPLEEETQEKQRHLSSSPIYISDSPIHISSTPETPSDTNNFIYVSSDDESNHGLDISIPEEDDNYEVSVKVWWRFVRFDKFKIRKFQKLACLFEHYSGLENVDQSQILLTLNDVMIHQTDTPDSLNLTIANIIEGGITSFKDSNKTNAVSKNQVPSVSEDELELKVQRKACKEPLIIRFLKTQKMKIFMLKCAESLELPVEKLKFSFDGETINSSDTPVDLDLEGGECIDLHILE